jgi:hypothetical protein
MSYTLRGRLETRLVVSAVPFLAACAVALIVAAWWPVKLAALMIAVGLFLDVTAYHWLLRYQAGWVAIPLGLLELGIVLGIARAIHLPAPLDYALLFFAGAWLLGQVIVHGGLPLARLSYGDDGGEVGRAGAGLGAAAVVALALTGGVAWATTRRGSSGSPARSSAAESSSRRTTSPSRTSP